MIRADARWMRYGADVLIQPRSGPLRTVGKFVFCSAFFAATVLASRAAQAFERQWHIGVDAGYAHLSRAGSWPGYAAGGHLAYGLSDAFNALLELDWSHHPSAHTHVASAAIGAAYALDVTRLVPYGGILVGGYRLIGDLPATGLGGQLVLGADYQLTRDWALGVQGRWHQVPIVDRGETFSYATVMLRLESLWGF